MKKTVVFRCDNAKDVRHSANFFSRVMSLTSIKHANVNSIDVNTILDVLMQLDEWSKEQNLLPKELKEEGEKLLKRRRELIQLLKNGQLESDEFNKMQITILDAENLVIDKILENEAIYPCIGVMFIDSELPIEQMFRFALQTAKTAGYELVEKLPDTHTGIIDMWHGVWVAEPSLFMDLTFLAAQKIEYMGGELFAIVKRILDDEILPEGMSKEEFDKEYKSYFQFLWAGCLDFIRRLLGVDDSDDKD